MAGNLPNYRITFLSRLPVPPLGGYQYLRNLTEMFCSLKLFFMKMIAVALLCFAAVVCKGQYTFSAVIKDSSTKEVLPGATIITARQTLIADSGGTVLFSGLPEGVNNFRISFAGYGTLTTSFTLPDTALHYIFLLRAKEDLENITIVSSTRITQRIENSPLKVEVLGREEMDEENSIKPGNIASILGDISGIQIQQSSAVSGNANVRIQGLEGRYTQILRDGMPLFEGFSGGFGVLQIAPLDLKQIELIKGSASTLYGGGAIGGLINLISKKPTLNQEAEITVNQTTLKETNINTYVAKRNKAFGYTFFGGATHQGITDVNGDGLSDVPELNALILHPRIFIYPSQKTTIIAGYSGTFENRNGGDLLVVDGKKDITHQFFEKNISQRHTGELQLQFSLRNNNRIEVKSIASSFTRSISTATHYFKGSQFNYFTELSHILAKEKFSLVSGINMVGDQFKILPSDPVLISNFSNNTIGAFSQLTANLSEKTIAEAGLRIDHHEDYGNFVLPRLAVFHRFSEQWGSRFGLGLGYKTPNVLAQQTVEYSIEDIEPLPVGVKTEKSIGYSAEVNFKKEFSEESSLFVNQAFFLTQLNNPLVTTEQSNGHVLFNNEGKNIISKGFDTYIKGELASWELYAGYTFTIAERNYLTQDKFMPLTPMNRFAFVVVYEPDKWRFGLEGSFTGSQYRYDYTKTPGYLFLAAVISRTIGDRITVVLNCENLADYRQSKEESLYTGTITSPVFKPLWAPIDGRVANISLKWNFGKIRQQLSKF